MKIIQIILLVLGIIIPAVSIAQQVSGVVYEWVEGSKKPLTGANVYQLNTTNGTISDEEGFFKLKLNSQQHDALVISYVGYRTDTIYLHERGKGSLEIVMEEQAELDQVEIVSRQQGSFVSRTAVKSIETISGQGLRQAACCNLSESFENSATVNVSYSDAITGAKHIEMLGLAGKYTQFLQENIPNLRGLAGPYGLTFYPGDWMESIQVSKGASSVTNGYESITGQINIELKKPAKKDNLFVNVYGNSEGRFEANLVSTLRMNDNWTTMIFAHGDMMNIKHDNNDDGFLDLPLTKQINLFNRWEYASDNIHFDFGAKYLVQETNGGQTRYIPGEPSNPENGYGVGVTTNRAEANAKLGYIFDREFTTIGFQNQFTWQDQESFYGLNTYDANQRSYYGNLLFQSYIGNRNHQYTTGLSYNYIRFDQMVNDSVFNRTENVPGAFFQYTYTVDETLNVIAGVREDYNSEYGFIFTPRLHVRYSPNQVNIFRANAGKGSKPVNVIPENTALFTTSKMVRVTEELEMESAWNYGVSYTRIFNVGTRELSLVFDYFYTNFINQTIVDRVTDPNIIYIYNLDGRSYSQSIQGEMKWEPIKNLQTTLAFRYNDVKTTMNSQLQNAEMINRYKGLISLSYQTNLKKWQFDANIQWNGQMTLPPTYWNPVEFQRPAESPDYWIINAQVTKFFKKWELYLGGENLTNYMQHHPIIEADNPFGEYFDATIVWAPIMGIVVYSGIRFTIQ